MYILPAIDLKDRKVVRLYKGDFNTVHQVAQDPLETARAFSEAGARWIHMVDLDGARGGTRINGGSWRRSPPAPVSRWSLGAASGAWRTWRRCSRPGWGGPLLARLR